MPYDGLVTRKIKNELSQIILDGKIDKIIQPNKDDIILSIRNNRINYKLLLSSNAQNARTHLTKQKSIENPQKPFNFCMVLRKYLMNARLTEIYQPSNDRILNFTFENSNELGDKETKILIIEMMGKYSNIILTSKTGLIIDSIHHVDFEVSSVREVMPGRQYVLPLCQDKVDPFNITELDFNNLVKSRCILTSRLIGISKMVESKLQNLSYTDFINFINNTKPCVFFSNNKPTDFYFTNIDISHDNIKEFTSISGAVDFLYTQKIECAKIDSTKHELAAVVSHIIAKTQKKLKLVEEKLLTTNEMEDIRIKGEILSANLYKVHQYSSEISLDNYYTDSTITIPLDINLSPSQNLQKLFKKYSKLKNTYTACSEQKISLTSDLTYFESLLFEIYTQNCIEDLEEIKTELVAAGLLNLQQKKKKEIISKPIEVLFDNYKILIGKNNIQNDKLTFSIASKSDIWFHVKNAPGSHTILQTNSQPVSKDVLEKAASLAAFHSKLKNSPKVEVDYTTVKNVKKIPGAKPGMVTYENYKTIYIEPLCESNV